MAPDETLPAAGGEPPGRRPRVLRVLGVLAGVAVLAGVVVGSTLPLPYYAISPGSVLAVPGLVRVDHGPSYPPKGAVNLVTVFQGKVTAVDALRGWLDPDIDVLPEKRIIPPGVSQGEVERANQRSMATSKESALAVAFEHLGFDVVRGDGAVIDAVEPASPAKAAGLEAGDVITAIDGKAIELDVDAVHAFGAHKPGDRVTIRVAHGGKTRAVTATLAVRPDDPARPMLGVRLATKGLHFDFPYDVKVESERIGGPSAGLAYTLEVLDVLTPGELTGGRRVAATGTIELDGTVGEIGGIVQKTAAVRHAGIKTFLVPRGEYKAAKARAGDDLEVVPVDDLQDALRALARHGGNGLALPKLGPGGGKGA